MLKRIAIALLSLSVVAPSGQAASLALACSGTVRTWTSETPEAVKDYSIVIDFDRKAVSGFWAELGKDLETVGPNIWLPITSVDANSISFAAKRKLMGGDNSISGTVDRITGATEAYNTMVLRDGSSTTDKWDLRCKPTRPLF